MNKLIYEGIAPSYANVESHNYRSINNKWHVSVHIDNEKIINGELESDYRYFEFKVIGENITLWSAYRDSLYLGLNSKYTHENLPIPRYLQEFLLNYTKE